MLVEQFVQTNTLPASPKDSVFNPKMRDDSNNYSDAERYIEEEDEEEENSDDRVTINATDDTNDENKNDNNYNLLEDIEEIDNDSMETILTRLFDQEEETDLNLILQKAVSFKNKIINDKISAHLKDLKDLSDKLFNKTFDEIDERTYLCYMTTTTKSLTEIDGVILRHYFLENFAWKSDLLASLRILCSRLFFKGESQNIDIMIHSFANNWFSRYNRPSFIYGNIIGVYLVTYALILLNTDLHTDHSVPVMRSTSQYSMSNASIKTTRKTSGSMFDISSARSSYLDNESEGWRSSVVCITSNQFVMNTIAALNDNFVIVNPLLMRKQLRLYYSNVKLHEILLPKYFDDHSTSNCKLLNHKKRQSGRFDDENSCRKVTDGSIYTATENSNLNVTNNTNTSSSTFDVLEDPNDEVTDLRSLPSLRPINTTPSVASTRLSFELVSGTVKETVGPFGFLKEIEKCSSKQTENNNNNEVIFSKNDKIQTSKDEPITGSSNYSQEDSNITPGNVDNDGCDCTSSQVLSTTPIIKEGLQKILVNDLYKEIDDDNYEKHISSAFLFKDIPDPNIMIPMINNTITQSPPVLKKRTSFIRRLIQKTRRKGISEEVHTNSNMKLAREFKFTECFVVICDGELRIFGFDKDPNKVNSYSGHGKGEWTDWAKCLASVSLTGCYAELIGSSKRQSSQEEKKELNEKFGNQIYWKLELPYTMMDMVNEDTTIISTRSSSSSSIHMVTDNDGKRKHTNKNAKNRNKNKKNKKHKSKNKHNDKNNKNKTVKDHHSSSRNHQNRLKFEKMIFTSYTTETAIEFVNTCNYWSGIMSKVPNVKNLFLDDMNLTSFEYGFSPKIVESVSKAAHDIQSGNDDDKGRLEKLEEVLMRKKITEWKPIVHSCEVVDSGNTVEEQLGNIDRYMGELTGLIGQERAFLGECRRVYNGVLGVGSVVQVQNSLRVLGVVYENHRWFCLALLRERRRWRMQRAAVGESVSVAKR